jgi:hypothetical protein
MYKSENLKFKLEFPAEERQISSANYTEEEENHRKK